MAKTRRRWRGGVLSCSPDQHVERADQPDERRQHGDEHDHRAERRHVLPNQLLRPGEQVGSALDAGGFDAHQVRRAHDDQQHECGCSQGNDVVEAMRAGAAQCCRTAHASCGHSRCQGRDRLEQSAARALAQLRLRLSADRRQTASPPQQHRGEPVGELADRSADCRDLARDTRRRRRHGKAEAAQYRGPRPLKLTLA